MINDVARRIVWFKDADTPIFVPPVDLETPVTMTAATDEDIVPIFGIRPMIKTNGNFEHDDADDKTTEGLRVEP